jgi:hypothetical protein
MARLRDPTARPRTLLALALAAAAMSIVATAVW